MNTTRLALVLWVMLAGAAHAQSGGPLADTGLIQQNGASLTIGKRDANVPGVKGGDQRGAGLQPGFQLDIRFEPDSASPTPAHYLANSDASANPFAIAGSYQGAALGAMLAYERNGIESTLWSVAAAIRPLSALKLTASYADQDRGRALLSTASTTAWVVGANYMAGSGGTLLLGYGRELPDGVASTRAWSIGYEYPLSKRSYLYADASDKKAAATVRQLGIGIRAAF